MEWRRAGRAACPPGPAGLSTRLVELLGRHRLVTLVSPDPALRRRVVREVGEQRAGALPGGTWWLAAHPSTGDLRRLLSGLGLQPAMLVLEDAHLQPRAARALMTEVLDRPGALHLLLSSLHPLGHAGELVLQADDSLRLDSVWPAAPAQTDLPVRLRWRSRMR